MSVDNPDYRRAFVVTGDDAAGWAQAMTAEIDHGLKANGIASTLLRSEEFDAVFTRPIGERYFMVNINNQLDVPGVRKVSVMVDHPCTRYADIAGGDPAATTLGWVDRSHLPAAAALGSPYASIFLPHAGPDPVRETPGATEREIDLFFSGTLGETWDRARWAAAHPQVPAPLVELIFLAAERLSATLAPVLPLFRALCAEHGLDPERRFSRQNLCWIVTQVHEIAETNRRNAVLLALPEALTVAIASPYLPSGLRNRRNLHYLGPIADFAQIRRSMRNARLVLNTTSKFPDGSHERIWFGMAEGALIFADRSRYLEEQFAHLENILYLPQREIRVGDLDYLADLVRESAPMDTMIGRASALYGAHHTWTRRVRLIDEAVNGGPS